MSAHTHVKWGTLAAFGSSVGVTGPSAAAAMVATAAIRDAGYGAFVEVVSINGKSVAVALGEDQQEALANANKIAAAPDLLEALRGLDEAYCRAGAPLSREERHEDRMRLIAARAAIAKATPEAKP